MLMDVGTGDVLDDDMADIIYYDMASFCSSRSGSLSVYLVGCCGEGDERET
jgi:hypothetical protein